MQGARIHYVFPGYLDLQGAALLSDIIRASFKYCMIISYGSKYVGGCQNYAYFGASSSSYLEPEGCAGPFERCHTKLDVHVPEPLGQK